MKLKSLLLPALLVSHLVWMGCTNDVEMPVVDCSLSDLSVSVTSQEGASCSGPGSISVAGSGGVAPYEFSIDGTNFAPDVTITDLSAGTYTITVRDAEGCTSTVETTLAGDAGSVSLAVDFTNTTCGESTGTISASATGGTPPYSFSLNGGASQDNGSFTGLSNGESTISVVDSEGCDAERSVIITTGVSLGDDVAPIIAANCAITGCHNGSRSPNLTTNDNIIGSANRIMARTSAGTMPPSGRPDLTEEEIQLIACWVNDGAPNN